MNNNSIICCLNILFYVNSKNCNQNTVIKALRSKQLRNKNCHNSISLSMSIIPKYRKYAFVAYKSTLSENNDFHLLTGRKPTSIGGSPEWSNLSCYANKDCCSINSRSVSIMKYSLSSILRTSCTSMAFAVWSALSSKESFTLQSAVTDLKIDVSNQ